jgi:hypothetical protein
MEKICLFIVYWLIASSILAQKSAKIKTANAVCNAGLFNYTIKSSVDGTLGGITYSWTRAAVNGITNSAGSGNSAVINEYLVNNTNQPITVDYIVSMKLGDEICPHMDILRLKVQPTPHINSTLVAQICDSSIFSYLPTTTVLGSSISWQRPSMIGMANTIGSGISDINERLIDTAFKILKVPYYFSSIANGCIGKDTLSLTVIPRPFGSIQISSDTVYSGNPSKMYFASTDTIPYQYAWSFGDGQIAKTKINPIAHYYNTRRSGTMPINVAITNRYGCSNSYLSSLEIKGDSTLKTVDTFAVQRHYSFQVFPVPFYSDLKLKYTLDGPSETAMYIVNDLSGRLIYAQPLELTTGSYIIKLPSEKLISGIVYVVKINSKTYQYEDKVYKK